MRDGGAAAVAGVPRASDEGAQPGSVHYLDAAAREIGRRVRYTVIPQPPTPSVATRRSSSVCS